MIKTILKIKGMHCRSCEVLIKENLSQIPGVKEVKSSWKNQTMEVHSQSEIEMKIFKQVVEKSGYQIGGDENLSWINLGENVWKETFFALIIALVVAVVAYYLGFFNVSVGGANVVGSLMVLFLGLTAGISTCMALVGGMVLAFSSAYSASHPQASFWQKMVPHWWFHAGRLSGYFLMGGLVALLGNVIGISIVWTGIISMLVAAVMLVLGVKLLGIFPGMDKLTFSLPLNAIWRGKVSKKVEGYSHWNTFFAGILTFFVPCSFTQVVLLSVISLGNFWSGAILMTIFAIGTIPGLLVMGSVGSAIKGKSRNLMIRTVAWIVIGLSVFNFGNGINLSGLTWPEFGGGKEVDQNQVSENVDGVQIIRMTQKVDGYVPNNFVIKKGIPVKWIITSENAYTCASGIAVPSLGISQPLKLGENVIEFTPEKTGKIRFTCLMGMYPGEFKVVE